MERKLKYIKFSIIFILYINRNNNNNNNSNNNNIGALAYFEGYNDTFRRSQQTNLLKGDEAIVNIPLNVYNAMHTTNQVKTASQKYLQNFLENLQRNISTSQIFSNYDDKLYSNHLLKLNDLAESFRYSAKIITSFISEVTQFFDIMQNETNYLLEKFTEIPTGTQHRNLFKNMQTDLENYFLEVDYFKATFNDIIDSILDYIISMLNSICNILKEYADIQQNMLINGNLKISESCFTNYMNFLQKWSARIFKCSSDINLPKVYDIYATTEITSRYIIEQIDYRIQKFYNCLKLSNFLLRCKFVKTPEKDFEKLFMKLDELYQHFDLMHGSQHINERLNWNWHRNSTMNDNINRENCIPRNFPIDQMSHNLVSCFNIIN